MRGWYGAWGRWEDKRKRERGRTRGRSERDQAEVFVEYDVPIAVSSQRPPAQMLSWRLQEESTVPGSEKYRLP